MTSDKVYEAALALIADGGLAACTYQAVAEKAGVNRSTLYRRWPTRAGLALEAIAARIDHSVAVPDTGGLHGDLVRLLAGVAAFLGTPLGRAAYSAAIEIGPDTAGRAIQARLWRERRAAVAPLFERAAVRGERLNTDPDLILPALAGAVHFRLFVSLEPADDAWISALVSAVAGTKE